MKIKWLIPVVPVLFSGVSYAEWFFRGTSSDWQAVQLDYVSGTQFQTCQSFAQGDAGVALALKSIALVIGVKAILL